MNGKGWARTREIEAVELLLLLALAESWLCAERARDCVRVRCRQAAPAQPHV